MKKAFKWIGVILALPILFFVIFSVLLYIPAVQNYMVRQATAYASRALDMDVAIGNVRLSFPLDLQLNRFVTIQQGDTLLAVDAFNVDVRLLPLFRQRVDVDALDLSSVQVDTRDLVEAAQIRGKVAHLYLNAHGVEWKAETVNLNEVLVEGLAVDIQLRDSVPEDTASQPSTWKIALQEARIRDSRLSLQMDTLHVGAVLGDVHLADATADLKEAFYQVRHLDLERSALALDLNEARPSEGLDYAHWALDSLELSVDSVVSQGRRLALALRKGAFRERSGLRLKELSGRLEMDSSTVNVRGVTLKTSSSKAGLDLAMDWSALETAGAGVMNVDFSADLGKADLLILAGTEAAPVLEKSYPAVPLVVRLHGDGNMRQMRLDDVSVELSGAFVLKASGVLEQLMDERSRSGSVRLKAQTYDLGFWQRLFPDYRIPSGMRMEGLARVKGTRYAFDGLLTEGDGRIKMAGAYDLASGQYTAHLDVNQLNLHHFMPKDSLFLFSGNFQADGCGWDPFSARTRMALNATVDQLQYGQLDLNGMGTDLNLADRQLTGTFHCDNDYLRFSADLSAVLQQQLSGELDLNVHTADFQRMNVSQDPLTAAFRFHATASTDQKEELQFDGKLTEITIQRADKVYTPKDLLASTFMRADTLFAHAESGDFLLDVDANEGPLRLGQRFTRFAGLLQKQLEERRLQLDSLQTQMPDMHVTLKSGRNNPISNVLALKGFTFKELSSSFSLSPERGVQGDLSVYAFRSDSLQLDTIRFHANQESGRVNFQGQVHNSHRNPQFVFNSLLNGAVYAEGVATRFRYYDKDDRLGMDMGLQATFAEDGYKFIFHPARPLIAYQTFNLTPDNYIYLHHDMRVEGDMKLLTDEGVGLLFAAHPGEGELQNMQLDFYQVDLGDVMNVLPYLPRLDGLLNGSVSLSQKVGEEPLAKANFQLDNFSYENNPMGNLALTLDYEPKEDGTHAVEARVLRNGVLISDLVGDYNAGTGGLQMGARLIRFPAELVNGFIPDHMIGLRGTLEGNFKLDGNKDAPVISGEVRTDSVHLYSDIYGMDFRLQDRSLSITESRLKFDNFLFYSTKNDEMTVNGNVDFSNLSDIRMALTMRARNFQVVDRARNNISLLYGKAYVNFNATLDGPLDGLKMRGTVNLLGTTDVTYVLKDSPLTVEDRLSDLVTFVDFSDTTQVYREVAREEAGGIDMVLNLSIDEGAQVNCDLSSNRESYVDLQGGGDLVFRYTPEGNMYLTGRYTINSGEMKYALPVIPLKTFTLKSGSYVEFTGDVMNPRLNLSATEQVRASVGDDGGSSRSVLFDVGVEISKTLQDLGLAFTIDAPEDLNVQNELAGFSAETRGKLAVTMLATGLYVSENNTSGGISMSSALNSFLQSEISSIAGNAFRSIDLSFGMEDGTASDGSSTTDYSFRFAKRLWNNRVSIIIGGKVSTGANVDQSDSFIDDISIEYRLDNTGTRYVKLFHEKTFDSLLDGEITETGGGLVLRKKMTRLGELFIFRSTKRREALIRQWEERRRLQEEAKSAEQQETDCIRQAELRQKDNETLKAAEREMEKDDRKEAVKSEAIIRKRNQNR